MEKVLKTYTDPVNKDTRLNVEVFTSSEGNVYVYPIDVVYDGKWEKNVYTFRSHELYENNKITNEEKVTRKDMTFAELEPYFVGIRTLWANAVYYNKQ
jgi:hypothetical protein